MFSAGVGTEQYDDGFLRDLLGSVKTIAVVGASANWNRPSYFVMKYLQSKDYKMVPVNPGQAGKEILGELAYASVLDIPDQVDMVDMFRPAKEADGLVDDAIAIGAKALWMQFGIVNADAAARAREAGLKVVMDRCPKVEYSRLFGEIGRHGFNSNVITTKKRPVKAVKKLM